MKLIVGLGNPGKEYSKTRHNVGFIVVDNYLNDVKWEEKKDCMLYIKKNHGKDVCFMKPLTFMNLSGNAVSRIVNYYKIDIHDILVIHDDLDLNIGSFKIKTNSSSGGHNGINSIISMLHSQDFARLKIGIGHSNDIPTVDYVLGKLSKEEINKLDSDIYKEIIDTFINDGVDKAMLLYNNRNVQ